MEEDRILSVLSILSNILTVKNDAKLLQELRDIVGDVVCSDLLRRLADLIKTEQRPDIGILEEVILLLRFLICSVGMAEMLSRVLTPNVMATLSRRYDFSSGVGHRELVLYLKSLIWLLSVHSGETDRQQLSQLGIVPDIPNLIDKNIISEDEARIIRNESTAITSQILIHKAVLDVQRIWRGHVSRKGYKKIKSEFLFDTKELLIQRCGFEENETDQREEVLQEQSDDHNYLRQDFKSRLSIIESAESVSDELLLEYEQRLIYEKQQLLDRHHQLKLLLCNSHNDKLTQLNQIQAAEVHSIESEKDDILLITDLPQRTKLLSDHQLKCDKIKQDHAKARLYIRNLHFAERENKVSEWEGEVEAFTGLKTRVKRYQLIIIHEEKYRGVGAAGRLWWANTGITHEEEVEWNYILKDHLRKWTPHSETLTRQVIISQRLSQLCYISKGYGNGILMINYSNLSLQESTTRVTVLADQFQDYHCDVNYEVSLYRLLLKERTQRHVTMFNLLRESVTVASNDITDRCLEGYVVLKEEFIATRNEILLNNRIRSLCDYESNNRMYVETSQEKEGLSIETQLLYETMEVAEQCTQDSEYTSRKLLLSEELLSITTIINNHYTERNKLLAVVRISDLCISEQTNRRVICSDEVMIFSGNDVSLLSQFLSNKFNVLVSFDEIRLRNRITVEQTNSYDDLVLDERCNHCIRAEDIIRSTLADEELRCILSKRRICAIECTYIDISLKITAAADLQDTIRHQIESDFENSLSSLRELYSGQMMLLEHKKEQLSLINDEFEFRMGQVGDRLQQLKQFFTELTDIITSERIQKLENKEEHNNQHIHHEFELDVFLVDETKQRLLIMLSENTTRTDWYQLGHAEAVIIHDMYAARQLQRCEKTENRERSCLTDCWLVDWSTCQRRFNDVLLSILNKEQISDFLQQNSTTRIETEGSEEFYFIELSSDFRAPWPSLFVKQYFDDIETTWSSTATVEYSIFVSETFPLFFQKHILLRDHHVGSDELIAFNALLILEQSHYFHSRQGETLSSENATRRVIITEENSIFTFISNKIADVELLRIQTDSSIIIQKLYRRTKARIITQILQKKYIEHKKLLEAWAEEQEHNYAESSILSFQVVMKARVKMILLRKARRLQILSGGISLVAVAAAAVVVRGNNFITVQMFARAKISELKASTQCNLLLLRARLQATKDERCKKAIVKWIESVKQRNDDRKAQLQVRQRRAALKSKKTLLTSCFKAYQDRIHLSNLLKQKERNVTIAQAFARAKVSEITTAYERELIDTLRFMDHLVVIQTYLQSFASTKIIKEKIALKIHPNNALNEIAIVIQKEWRRVLATKCVKRKRIQVLLREEQIIEESSAMTVQRCYRGFIGRRMARHRQKRVKFEAFRKWQLTCTLSVLTLQSAARAFASRLRLRRLMRNYGNASIVIQLAFRRTIAQRIVSKRKSDLLLIENLNLQQQSANVIQSAFRVLKSKERTRQRRDYLKSQNAIACEVAEFLIKIALGYSERKYLIQLKYLQLQAAIAVQCAWRSHLSRKQLLEKKNEFLNKVVRIQRNVSALRIQSCFRKFQRRRNIAAVAVTRFMVSSYPAMATVRSLIQHKKQFKSVSSSKKTCLHSVQVDPVTSFEEQPSPHEGGVDNDSIAFKYFLRAERKSRKLIVGEAIEQLKRFSDDIRKERSSVLPQWLVSNSRRAIINLFNHERRSRSSIESEQLLGRREIKLRQTKLIRIRGLKRKKGPVLPNISKSHSHEKLGEYCIPQESDSGFLKRKLPPVEEFLSEENDFTDVFAMRSRVRERLERIRKRSYSSMDCVDASNKKIGDDGCITLLSRIRTSSDVVSLVLDHNNLTDYSAQQISEYLQTNRSVTALSLAGNSHISDSGGTALASALKVNPSLEFLDTDNTSISVKTKQLLGYLLALNHTSRSRALVLPSLPRKQKSLAL